MPFTPRTAGTLTTEVLARVRDPNGVMHTAAFVRARLSDAQRCLNALLGFVVGNAAINLNALENFYVVSTITSNAAIRLIGIRGGLTIRELGRMPDLQSFLIYGATWPQHVTNQAIESWALIGRDVLVLYPATTADIAIGMHYVKLTNTLTDANTLMEFSPDQDGLAVTLTEALLLLRQRDLGACQRALARLHEALAPELVSTPLSPALFGMTPVPEQSS